MIPEAALYGWSRNYNKIVYDKEAPFCGRAQAVLKAIKKKKMMKSSNIEKISLEYIAINENTHIAEIIVETDDSYAIMD